MTKKQILKELKHIQLGLEIMGMTNSKELKIAFEGLTMVNIDRLVSKLGKSKIKP